jgi:NAD(P)-dependent dehydrogenase (short-subunit alcohol dehydrogenase family)
MKETRNAIQKYWPLYKWSNVFEMIRNNGRKPAVCGDDFRGRLLVITGGTSGIGYYTIRKYASCGANILCINRNEDKSIQLCEEIKRDYGVRCEYRIADLGNLADIHKAGKDLVEMDAVIDVFIHNAGMYINRRVTTADGLEMTFAVNYLSSFIINYLLMDKLRKQGSSRILMVNSEGYRFAVWGPRLDDLNWQKRRYSGLQAYGSAKICQLLSMISFEDYFRGSGVTLNAMHPGAVRTETGNENGYIYKWFKRNFIDRISKSPEISADALYHLGVSEEMKDISGKFFNLTTEEELAPPAVDREFAQKLWEHSMRVGGLS